MSQDVALSGREYICAACDRPIPFGQPRIRHNGGRLHGPCYVALKGQAGAPNTGTEVTR